MINVLIAYLVGSIPFGLILSNLFGNGKLRESGSKNIGATNVLRTQGKWLGALTLLLDFSKGFLAYKLLIPSDSYGLDLIQLATMAAPVIGHMFPIWLKFKGGKGVATFLGILCATDIYAFVGAIAIWAIVFGITKISSLAGMTSLICSCGIFSYIKWSQHLDFINQLYVLIGLVVLVIIRHHENIKRLLNKDEIKV